MKLLAERITDYFIRNEITTEEMREENIYGIEVILGKVLTYTTLIVLGIWKQNMIPTIFFMVVFFSLRGRTGGNRVMVLALYIWELVINVQDVI